MFFRMLKNDLRSKRSLNVILFLFITFASALVFVGAAQVYSGLTGNDYTRRVCHSTDAVIGFRFNAAFRDEKVEAISGLLNECDGITSYCFRERVQADSECIDFPNYDEKESPSFLDRSHVITKMNTDYDLVFDTDDKPFYVKNGQVALSVWLRDLTGAQVGDKVRITTDLGYTYELEIGAFFKSKYKSMYILSDADYEKIAQEFPVRIGQFALCMPIPDHALLESLSVKIVNESGTNVGYSITSQSGSDDEIIANIVSVFLVLISVFMILLILMTIRFTMIAALKEEEKEIGMMRAIGVDSLKFRWLFAAKYIAFALIGGTIGALIGYPLSRKVVLMFGSGRINPPFRIMTMLGIAAVAGIVLVMILFSVFVMRRMKRISVIDAIHGENRGERFGRHTALHLHKRRIMPVPLYLAISDILTRFKRYIFLILAYTLGASIILLTGSLRHSVLNPSFARYFLMTEIDFATNFSDEAIAEYLEREEYDGIPFYEQLNTEMKEAGIPAHIEMHKSTNAVWTKNGMPITDTYFCYDLPDNEKLTYRKGGRAPKLENEIAMSWFSAKAYGISLGDTLTFSFTTLDYADGELKQNETEKQFVVTAFADFSEQNMPYIIAGTEFTLPDEGSSGGYDILGFVIDSDDKEGVFRQICDKYGRENIMTSQEYIEDMLEDYDFVLTLLMKVMTGTVLFVNILITALYLNIFIAEDTPEIALLKSLGFRERSVKHWQNLRMLLLTVLALIVTVILYHTAIAAAADILFEQFIGLTGFRFEPFPLFVYVLTPLMVIGTVLIPTVLRMRTVKHIDIRQMNEE